MIASRAAVFITVCGALLWLRDASAEQYIFPFDFPTYASSYLSEHPPHLAVDNEFERTSPSSGPTCFQPDPQSPDLLTNTLPQRTTEGGGIHWFLLDLGRVERNVTGLDISWRWLNSFNNTSRRRLMIYTSAWLERLPELRSSTRGGLQGDTFQLCATVTFASSAEKSAAEGGYHQSFESGRTATLRVACDVNKPESSFGRSARWILLVEELPQDGMQFPYLQLCFLDVLVAEVASGCFNELGSHYKLRSSLSPYRKDRGNRLAQCKQQCHEDLFCEVLRFTGARSRRGECLLMRSTVVGAQQSMKEEENSLQPPCQKPLCTYVENVCHRGRLVPLSLESRSTSQLVWRVSSTQRALLNENDLVLSVHLQGVINCPTLTCDVLQVVLVNTTSGYSQHCAYVDPRQAMRLSSLTLHCQQETPIEARNVNQLQLISSPSLPSTSPDDVLLQNLETEAFLRVMRRDEVLIYLMEGLTTTIETSSTTSNSQAADTSRPWRTSPNIPQETTTTSMEEPQQQHPSEPPWSGDTSKESGRASSVFNNVVRKESSGKSSTEPILSSSNSTGGTFTTLATYIWLGVMCIVILAGCIMLVALIWDLVHRRKQVVATMNCPSDD